MMLDYNKLPKTIISPLSGKLLTLQPRSKTFCSADFFEDCEEFCDSLATYSDISKPYGKQEQIYIPIY